MVIGLTYDHDDEEFFYFRCGLFPIGLIEHLLIILSGLDDASLLEEVIPAIPNFIATGTQIANLQGGTYTVENDLYLLLVETSPHSTTAETPLSFLEEAKLTQPIAIYSLIPANDEAVAYPEARDPTTKTPNIETYPGWYVPDIGEIAVTVSSRKSSYPFWTKSYFGYWTAYTGTYTCTGLPYNVHVTCFPGELSHWEQPTNYYEHGYFRVDGYYRNIQSNASTWFGLALFYDSGTPIQSLNGSVYAPDDPDDPVIYYYPGPGEPPENQTVGLDGLFAGLFVLGSLFHVGAMIKMKRKPLLRAEVPPLGLAQGTYPIAEADYPIAEGE